VFLSAACLGVTVHFTTRSWWRTNFPISSTIQTSVGFVLYGAMRTGRPFETVRRLAGAGSGKIPGESCGLQTLPRSGSMASSPAAQLSPTMAESIPVE